MRAGDHPATRLEAVDLEGLQDRVDDPAQANFAYWRDRNACSGTTPDERIDVGERFCETYTQCDAGVQVGLCSIAASPTARTDSGGSGHETYLNPDLDIARTAWEFLSQFSLPDP